MKKTLCTLGVLATLCISCDQEYEDQISSLQSQVDGLTEQIEATEDLSDFVYGPLEITYDFIELLQEDTPVLLTGPQQALAAKSVSLTQERSSGSILMKYSEDALCNITYLETDLSIEPKSSILVSDKLLIKTYNIQAIVMKTPFSGLLDTNLAMLSVYYVVYPDESTEVILNKVVVASFALSIDYEEDDLTYEISTFEFDAETGEVSIVVDLTYTEASGYEGTVQFSFADTLEIIEPDARVCCD